MQKPIEEIRPIKFQDVLGLFSVTAIVMYSFTWGYIYALNIPESPDLAKTANFFISAVLSTLFQGIFYYLISHEVLFAAFCFSSIYFLRDALFSPSLRVKFFFWRKNFLSNTRLLRSSTIFIFVVPLVCLGFLQVDFEPVWVYSFHRGWIQLSVNFVLYSVGLAAVFLIAILTPVFMKNAKNLVYLAWLFSITYACVVCFHLSKSGIEFMNFPVAIIDKSNLERLPHLWFSERGRYVAKCGKNQWRLYGIGYDNKEFYISDPRSEFIDVVCRYQR